MMTFISTSVVVAFFVGMLFRDIALIILVRMARRARERGGVTVDGKRHVPVTSQSEMEALAKAIVDRTMAVELDSRDGMLYLYNKADGQFLAQATDFEKLTDRLRQRYGTGRYYVLDDGEVINT